MKRHPEAFLIERDRILRELDVQAAREKMPWASDEVVLVSLHKARYEVVTMPDELRRESARWLHARGFNRLTNQPINLEAPLPGREH